LNKVAALMLKYAGILKKLFKLFLLNDLVVLALIPQHDARALKYPSPIRWVPHKVL
jgi:hypothetical protein